ncbi:ATP-binding cassette domain-containing protein [Bacillus kwashiorkori]|uniref:ABC transporter ATP-binding protein/permease n=1 Tax=Bacillus kwashiorkori TaxID=1522318 RepID=UPI0007866B97|nr:ABC transporter ATP-binding protein/permease [Bacillus kwashiorkori]
MLSVKHIKKSYTTGDFTQTALNDINLNFRKREFVAILGTSGSGKTTFLNVIGGLDQYDSGDLIINGKSTKDFKDVDWDAYRNNSVGFVFQSYNLISHLNIISNVEMGMTLSGVSAKEKRRRAIEVLEKVGLKDHLHKKPNQLSGGQMQRVAIARALANDPDIILADEPTGALDSQTSVQIMELIKEIAQDKLVIMVTHNPELAKQYANRIVQFKDGQVVSDSNPLVVEDENKEYELKKTGMNFFTALKLSANNIKTKKGRTFLTSFASSIGIIGIALVLSLSNGFNKKIDEFEVESLSALPITISQSTVEIDPEMLQENSMLGKNRDETTFPDEKAVYPVEPIQDKITHENKLTEEYVEHIEQLNPSLVNGISYTRLININLLKKSGNTATMVKTNTNPFGNGGFISYPKSLNKDQADYLKINYDLLAGDYPKEMNEIILVVDNKNQVSKDILQAFGLNYEANSIDFDQIIGTEYKVILNNDFYQSIGGLFTINGNPQNLIELWNNKNAVDLRVIGVLRQKEEIDISVIPPGFIYSDELAKFLLKDAKESNIVVQQKKADYNVLTGEGFDLNNNDDLKNKEMLLASLGATDIPYMIAVYPKDFDAKDDIVSYLDKFNEGKAEEDKVAYSDLASNITKSTGGIMSAITAVLIGFSAISLIVSLIMVGIITYISVLERTKEIGILRSLGARKKDITRVFNAETFIIGVSSGLLGIMIAVVLIFPINIIIENFSGLETVAKLNPLHAILLVVISLLLTILGGSIPAKMAAKKDPVEALRTE